MVSFLWCLKKAFDNIDHPILFKKIRAYGVDDLALYWFRSYITIENKDALSMVSTRLALPLLLLMVNN